jgi:hypothetical protein
MKFWRVTYLQREKNTKLKNEKVYYKHSNEIQQYQKIVAGN